MTIMKVEYPEDVKAADARKMFARGWEARGIASAALAGSVITKRKSAAARLNGAKGGRPPLPETIAARRKAAARERARLSRERRKGKAEQPEAAEPVGAE